ncbi:MAG: GNAT family N-acetyltransferase [Chloroflexota bacterium]|nr:GNAT family N-acetyltransferase [Chloroflexota bacterium]
MVVEIHPATGERFPDLAQILAPRRKDAPACWCLTYRVTSSEFGSLRGEDRPTRLRALCEQENAPGVIAYVDGVPAGWCAFGPRNEMGRLQRSRTIPQIDDRPVWSIVCFVVRAAYRRQGLTHQLLKSAIAYARSRGVQTLEAYPIESGGTRVSAAFAFVGTTSLFEAAGFRKVKETAARSGGLPRWIVRLDVNDVE